MPYGYVIANVSVTKPEQYQEYIRYSTAAAQAHGAEFIVRGGRQQVSEGQMHPRTVILRFASYEQALAFYDSPEYRRAREARAGAAQMSIVCVEGV